MRHSEEKLKKLLNKVPQGFLIDTPWLTQQNIDRRRAYYYIQRGWLEKVTQGLYRRPYAASENQEVKSDWKTTILSLQTLMGYEVRIGGETALYLAGHRHYMKMASAEIIYLYGPAPGWIKRLPTRHHYVLRSHNLFSDESVSLNGNSSNKRLQRLIDTEETPPWEWPLITSSPEQAILEMLKELPKKTGFHNVDMVFESLSNLRPNKVQSLLENCNSVKTKRLFFVFADRHRHGWWKHVDQDKVDLGKGPRALFKDGRIHPKYNISVPKDFMDNERSYS